MNWEVIWVGVAAIVACIAAVIACSQAVSARKQVGLAREAVKAAWGQADSAAIQAGAAKEQVQLMREANELASRPAAPHLKITPLGGVRFRVENVGQSTAFALQFHPSGAEVRGWDKSRHILEPLDGQDVEIVSAPDGYLTFSWSITSNGEPSVHDVPIENGAPSPR